MRFKSAVPVFSIVKVCICEPTPTSADPKLVLFKKDVEVSPDIILFEFPDRLISDCGVDEYAVH